MNLPEMQIIQYRDLDAREARAVTERIKSQMGDLMLDVAKAWHGRVWIALDYPSWKDYLHGEFGHAPIALPREERQAVAALLRGQGMSTRAIGAATGTGDATVRRDLATAPNDAVNEPVQVTGLDGRVRNYAVTCTKPEAAQPAPLQTVTCPTCGGTGKVTQ